MKNIHWEIKIQIYDAIYISDCVLRTFFFMTTHILTGRIFINEPTVSIFYDRIVPGPLWQWEDTAELSLSGMKSEERRVNNLVLRKIPNDPDCGY
jgi:hypothetical protein